MLEITDIFLSKIIYFNLLGLSFNGLEETDSYMRWSLIVGQYILHDISIESSNIQVFIEYIVV